jgi:predicted MPP superfamily phosphohydrolase
MSEDENRFLNWKVVLGFIIVFETFSLFMHYYVFSHLFYLLDVDSTGWFLPFIIVSSLLWLLSMGIGMMHASLASRAFHIVSSLWLGLLFMFMFTLVGWDVARQFVDPPRELVGATVLAIAIGAFAYGLMNARLLRTKEYTVTSDKVEGEVRIAHLSDVHIGAFYTPKFLKRIVKVTNGLEPDMVLITGDLADGAHPYSDDTFQPLNELDAPVYFVTGNHEHYAGLSEVLTALSATKVQRLVNGTVDVKGLRVLGVDFWSEADEVATALEENGLDRSRFTVLMYHVPRELDVVKERGVDLMLTGHTHGGQFFPFNLMARAFWKRYNGLYDLGSTNLFVSSGIGTWGPPIRLGTISQIALFRIRNGTPGGPA